VSVGARIAVEARIAGALPRTKEALRAAVLHAPESVVFTTTGPGARETFPGTAVPSGARLAVSRPRWSAVVALDGVGLRLD
jgi:hypothetical protein